MLNGLLKPIQRTRPLLLASPYDSPFGPLALLVDAEGSLHRIAFLDDLDDDLPKSLERYGSIQRDDTASQGVRRQLDAYFDGKRWTFDLPLADLGTEFQQQVWNTLQTIPAGQTWSYRQLAEHIGRPKAVRAVGRANALNPIPIVIPCHRLVGSDGSLTGFAGGLEMKRRLIEHERRAPSSRNPN